MTKLSRLLKKLLICLKNSPLTDIYFVLSPILNISRFASAVLALSLFEGAYASEIFRAGIISIHTVCGVRHSSPAMSGYVMNVGYQNNI